MTYDFRRFFPSKIQPLKLPLTFLHNSAHRTLAVWLLTYMPKKLYRLGKMPQFTAVANQMTTGFNWATVTFIYQSSTYVSLGGL